MRVRDLLARPELSLRLAAGQPSALDQAITWCAPAEGIDPTRFLTPSCLLLTTGMGLNIQDARTWDAYAERLAAVPVCAVAFGLGPVHKALPPQLATACESHGLPLIEVPETTPFVSVLRHVEESLEHERFAFHSEGWTIADAATKAAASAPDELTAVLSILTVLAESLSVRVSLALEGQEIVSVGPVIAGRGKTLLQLPGQDGRSLALSIRGHEPSRVLQPVLGPTASVLSLQISHALKSPAPKTLQSPDLLDLTAGRAHALPAPGLLVRLSSPDAASLMTAVLRLHADSLLTGAVPCGSDVVVLLERTTTQAGTLTAALSPLSDLGERLPSLSAVYSRTEGSDAQLALEAVLAADRTPGLREAAALSVGSSLAEHVSPAFRRRAQQVLEKLQGPRQQTLLRTLEVYLDEAGSPARTSEILQIHRNTLLYRLTQIESLTGLDLSRGQDRFLIQLALAVRPER